MKEIIILILLCIESLICVVILKAYYEERLNIQYHEDKKRNDFVENKFFTYFVFVLIFLITTIFLIPLMHYHNDPEAPINWLSLIIVPIIILLFGLAGMCYCYGKEINKLKKEVNHFKFNHDYSVLTKEGEELRKELKADDLINKYQEQLCSLIAEIKPNNISDIHEKTYDIIHTKFYSIINKEDYERIENILEKKNAPYRLVGIKYKLINIHDFDFDNIFAIAFRDFLLKKYNLQVGIKYYIEDE